MFSLVPCAVKHFSPPGAGIFLSGPFISITVVSASAHMIFSRRVVDECTPSGLQLQPLNRRTEMPRRVTDLTGQIFGHLTVIRQVGVRRFSNNQTKAQWLLRCSCGREVLATRDSLLRKNRTSFKSCGCLQKGGQCYLSTGLLNAPSTGKISHKSG